MEKKPYAEYRNLSIWNVVKKELKELEKNQDVEITTQLDIVIGSLVKAIKDSGLLKENS